MVDGTAYCMPHVSQPTASLPPPHSEVNDGALIHSAHSCPSVPAIATLKEYVHHTCSKKQKKKTKKIFLHLSWKKEEHTKKKKKEEKQHFKRDAIRSDRE